MTHDEKVAFLLNDLGQRGVGKSTVAPPLYRILWRLGVEATPPLFASFWSTALMMGVWFAIGWGVIMWLFVWRGEDQPAAVFVTVSIVAGVLFGITMAAYYRWRARKLALPRWDSYPTQA
jgi:hypothetical protein